MKRWQRYTYLGRPDYIFPGCMRLFVVMVLVFALCVVTPAAADSWFTYKHDIARASRAQPVEEESLDGMNYL